nr:hypothetical protein [Kofleriaceae bacterium]
MPLLDVYFVGLVGADPGHIDRQVLAADARLKAKKLAPALVKSLATNDDSSATIAKGIGGDGVIVGQLVAEGKHKSLRLVIYNGTGAMTSMSEVPLGGGKTLSKDDVAVLKSNLGDEVSSLLNKGKKGGGKTEVADTGIAADTGAGGGGGGGGAAGDGDGDDPLGGNKAKPTTTATADASPDDPTSVKASAGASAASTPSPDGKIAADIGFGLIGRSFDPGPSTVRAYGSTAIPAITINAVAHPIAKATLAFTFDHTMGMGTQLEGTTTVIDSAISRWELLAGYALVHGTVDISPIVGVGGRSFSVNSDDMSRSPDGSYTYAVIGGMVSYPASPKLKLQAYLDFQPLIGGSEPTIGLVGASTRWGLDVGAAVEYQPVNHIFLRAAADYQRIEWSWDMQNGVDQGTALDSYPTGSLAVGARY